MVNMNKQKILENIFPVSLLLIIFFGFFIFFDFLFEHKKIIEEETSNSQIVDLRTKGGTITAIGLSAIPVPEKLVMAGGYDSLNQDINFATNVVSIGSEEIE